MASRVLWLACRVQEQSVQSKEPLSFTVSGSFKPAPLPMPRHYPKSLAQPRPIISVNALVTRWQWAMGCKTAWHFLALFGTLF